MNILTKENIEPGIYLFGSKSPLYKPLYRLYKNGQWFDSTSTISSAAALTYQSLRQTQYWLKVGEAHSCTLVADIHGNPVDQAPPAPKQLQLL